MGDSSDTFHGKGCPGFMRILGEWYLCGDGLYRPIIRATVLAGNGRSVSTEFIVDSGADCTILSAGLVDLLGLRSLDPTSSIIGFGGRADTIVVDTRISVETTAGELVTFRGEIPGLIEPESLDMSVFGADILHQFAVILDRRGEFVALIREAEPYQKVEP